MSATQAMTTSKKIGLATLVAGLCFVIAPPLSQAIDPAWVLMLVGFALLLYAVPKLHRIQAPGDGPAGTWGARLVMFGGALMLALGVTFLIWEIVGTPPEEGGPIGALWMLGFFSFLVGIIAFSIGSIRANVVPKVAPILLLVGIIVSVAIDMATGAFFESDSTTTEWGFILGVPLFGVGLAWIGYSLWQGRADVAARNVSAETSSPLP